MFDESHSYVQNVWAKYILMNGIFTVVMFGEQKLGLGSLKWIRLTYLYPNLWPPSALHNYYILAVFNRYENGNTRDHLA